MAKVSIKNQARMALITGSVKEIFLQKQRLKID